MKEPKARHLQALSPELLLVPWHVISLVPRRDQFELVQCSLITGTFLLGFTHHSCYTFQLVILFQGKTKLNKLPVNITASFPGCRPSIVLHCPPHAPSTALKVPFGVGISHTSIYSFRLLSTALTSVLVFLVMTPSIHLSFQVPFTCHLTGKEGESLPCGPDTKLQEVH